MKKLTTNLHVSSKLSKEQMRQIIGGTELGGLNCTIYCCVSNSTYTAWVDTTNWHNCDASNCTDINPFYENCGCQCTWNP